jgi:transposase
MFCPRGFTSHLQLEQGDLMNDTEFAACVAIDWAERKHYWHMAAGAQREHGHLEHTPEAIDRWAAALRQRFAGAAVAVCLEQSRGPLTYQLTKYPHLVLYPVHPATVSRYRAAFFPSGAKGDPTDAALLLDILLNHRQHLRRLNPDTADTRLIAMLCEQRRKLVDERTRHGNRLTACLKAYYPQPLEWIDDIDSPLGCDLLQRWPTLQQLQRAKPGTLRRFFTEHNSRSAARIELRIEAIRQATPAVDDPALLEAGAATVAGLVTLLKSLNAAIADLDRRLAELTPKHPEACLFAGLPGAGPALLPRLIAAFGTDRERFHSAAELAAYSGIAPVTRQSGQSKSVVVRRACPRFLRQTFQEFAACSRTRSVWASAFYQSKRDAGKNHQSAVRALAFKWIRILFRCWKDRQPYDEARYLRSLEMRRSPLTTSATDAPCTTEAAVPSVSASTRKPE